MAVKRNRPKLGFTITEILVVMVVISIIIALFVSLIGIPAYTRAQNQKTLNIFKTIKGAEAMFVKTNKAALRLTANAIRTSFGDNVQDYALWFENETLITVIGNLPCEANECVFLQLCVDRVSDPAGPAGNSAKLPFSGPYIEPKSDFAALIRPIPDPINPGGSEAGQGGTLFNLFVDAWRTPLRFSPSTSATGGLLIESAGRDKIWNTDDDLDSAQ